MKTYRCKHAVEAMRWTDTDEDREKFSEWFENHGAMFETNGPIALLPDLVTREVTREDSDHNRVQPGEWIVWMDEIPDEIGVDLTPNAQRGTEGT